MPDPNIAASDILARLDLARTLGADVGRMACEVLATGDLGIITKPDGSPVTRADQRAERLIREGVARHFPHDAILGEEEGNTPGTSGYRWVLDPIDGTKSFIAGIPTFGTLIGIEHQGVMVAGYAGFPMLREELWGHRGHGATWRRETPVGILEAPCVARPCLLPAQAVIETASPQVYAKYNLSPAHDSLCGLVQRCRSWNDAYSLALVATGRVDGAVGFKASIWDVAPFLVILHEAGAPLRSWQAGEIDWHAKVRTYLACCDTLRGPLQDALWQFDPASATSPRPHVQTRGATGR